MVAEVAELVDAHGSGPCARQGVGVRVSPSAPTSFELNESIESDALLSEPSDNAKRLDLAAIADTRGLKQDLLSV